MTDTGQPIRVGVVGYGLGRLLVETLADLEAARVLAVADHASGRLQAPVMVGFSFRFHPAMVRLKGLLAGELGRPRMAAGQYVWCCRAPDDAWIWAPDDGNGFINENACHLFDVRRRDPEGGGRTGGVGKHPLHARDDALPGMREGRNAADGHGGRRGSHGGSCHGRDGIGPDTPAR